MQITVLYVGSSLLAPLKKAEREINDLYSLELHVAAYNFGAPLADDEWKIIENDLSHADVVFVIHVMDGENAARLLVALERHRKRHHAVVVINCMPELMRRTKMGRLTFSNKVIERQPSDATPSSSTSKTSGQAMKLLTDVGSWVGKQAGRRARARSNNHGQYLKVIDLLPRFLKLAPTAGKLSDVKNYLFLFCYFLQPTPANIRTMLLYAIKKYVPDAHLQNLKLVSPETMPSVAIYHPDAAQLFKSFEKYERWYSNRVESSLHSLNPETTIGLLLMRPQVVSNTTKHYDALIRAIEDAGLAVIPAISTLMDNREACEEFFIRNSESNHEHAKSNGKPATKNSRVSQIVSLTGFSFVGGPAMNDSQAAAEFLFDLNRPYRSAISLDMQTIESWTDSQAGLNPVQVGMQIAIPEIDGATEPLVYGGIPGCGVEPLPLEDRCNKIARRLKRWNHLRTAPRDELNIALVLFCFPPNKGNIGTAADLDVIPSVFDTLKRLKKEGYSVEMPSSFDELRSSLLGGNSEAFGSSANVIYRMDADEYRHLCPYVHEAEREWGDAPGRINSHGRELLIQGLRLGRVFVGVQPTFGYEGDPMRLMMARSGGPHHGFLAFYTYLEKIFRADAVVHVGTHGALEFMPGKQVGLSGACWPDRLIGELPNVYVYSVNNPSEGTIAKRRSYAELISYLTPPIEQAGLYKDLANLKELITAYRQAPSETEQQRLFESIEECSRQSNLPL